MQQVGIGISGQYSNLLLDRVGIKTTGALDVKLYNRTVPVQHFLGNTVGEIRFSAGRPGKQDIHRGTDPHAPNHAAGFLKSRAEMFSLGDSCLPG